MPSNLLEKIAILLKDIENLQHSEKIRIIEEFVLRELNFLNQTYEISKQDLFLMNSDAVNSLNSYLETTPTTSEEQFNHLVNKSRFSSFIQFLNKKGLTSITISYKE